MTNYRIRFVHKISPSPRDLHDTLVCVPQDWEADRAALGRVLRDVGALPKGARLRSCRAESGKLVCFPMASVWHAIILEPADETIVECYKHAPEHTLEVRADSNVYAVGEYSQRAAFGITRMWRMPIDVRAFDRPFCGDSPPHRLTWVKVWYTGAIDSAERTRHAAVFTP